MSTSKERIEAICEAAAGLETDEQRAAYLNRTCADPSLRREVERLLAARRHHESARGRTTVIQEPADSVLAQDAAGVAVSGYRIIRSLGQGGMGVVYEAEEIESGRRVALKALGKALDSAESRQRFLREGLLAASINHPNTVYVFGTDEIDGRPVIAMELVGGGTLQDRIRPGRPMPAAEAVDAILQVIAGLEAAAAKGVLHRDIKPSNCFVETDGTIKVGDFGLSIPVDAEGTTKLTVTGSFTGTPAYAPPEQLRGEEFTLQGDIYAVGVTLYFLLTGKTPFEGENLVRMLATVLERPATSPGQLRPELPGGLCRVVLRCLEKHPARRFASYAELRAALLPFSSLAPSPATLSLRFLAGLVDSAALVVCHVSMILLSSGHWAALIHSEFYPGVKLWVTTLSYALGLLYYSVLEGIWGASMGKRICGLWVTSPNRGSPGFWRGLPRALVGFGLPSLPPLLFVWFGIEPRVPGGLVIALLFCTARRRNGFAALQDLASGTRVMRKAADGARPRLEELEEPPPPTGTSIRFGPYQVLGDLGKIDSGELLLGFDARLRRQVWIHKLPGGAPPVTPAWRRLARPGRLRWLNGRRTAGECWDAYEAGRGRPLAELIQNRQSWNRVRFWLLDLAEELGASAKDQTTPLVLGLDRVWISWDGRAKLLDFPVPTAESAACAGAGAGPQEFLNQVAVAALEGRTATDVWKPAGSISVPLPPHARGLLEELCAGAGLVPLAERLKLMLPRLAFVSVRRRLGLIAGSVGLPLVLMAVVIVLALALPGIQRTASEATALGHCLTRWSQLKSSGLPAGTRARGGGATAAKPDDGTREAFETYIAGRFQGFITNPASWTSLGGLAVIEQRTAAEQLILKRATPSPEAFRLAAEVVEPYLKTKASESLLAPSPSSSMTLLSVGAWVVFFGAAAPALVAALLFRGGLVLRTAGLMIVKKDGSNASRARVFWRALVAWLPVFMLPVVVGRLAVGFGPASWEGAVAVSLVVVAVAGLAVWAALLPERGWHDRIAGTALAPRE